MAPESVQDDPSTRDKLLKELEKLGCNVQEFGTLSTEALARLLMGIRSKFANDVDTADDQDLSRAKIAKGLAAQYRSGGVSGIGAFSEICHQWRAESTAALYRLQQILEMIDNTYFEYLNLGHEGFVKKYS